jgi:hypothetical protein
MAGTARMVIFGWFGMPTETVYQVVGQPFTYSSPFRLPRGYFVNILDRLTLEGLSRGVLEATGRMMVRDDFMGSRAILTGRG